MNSLNPKTLSLPIPSKATAKRPTVSDGLPTHFSGERFLKGPIPWNWLSKAASLPGKAIHVALVIWHLGGFTGKRNVRLSQGTIRELSVNRHSAYRGLENLEKAGLVSVERHTGRNSIVTILDV